MWEEGDQHLLPSRRGVGYTLGREGLFCSESGPAFPFRSPALKLKCHFCAHMQVVPIGLCDSTVLERLNPALDHLGITTVRSVVDSLDHMAGGPLSSRGIVQNGSANAKPRPSVAGRAVRL
ncbi:hypothetical protein PGT21_008169 [Puccinia graminis f. sp. tritici]|uniref:Uncharacterized protein n=1 Tax=Puccinia graminis f. sp. tritici TaxID=56615 RepID=A0A5B0N043_PUCGR|nr:hypothetical protein PGT21_008169 [Puccinia graminis f. sp. tritici]KAA1133501.1 hypothetical protein PGTUg99_019196 [Puccinia graminis f. sp. tritici]